MSVLITADSTCDLPKSIISEREITIIPLSILLGEKSFKDGIEVTREDVYEHVKKPESFRKRRPFPRLNIMIFSERRQTQATVWCTSGFPLPYPQAIKTRFWRQPILKIFTVWIQKTFVPEWGFLF